MDFIFDNFQIVIIIVAVVFSGLQKLWEMKRNREAQEEPWEPAEEDFRPVGEFQPAPHSPPDLPRRMVPPPLTQFVAAPQPELERQQKMEERLRALRSAKTGKSAKSAKAPKLAGKVKGNSRNLPQPIASPSKLRERLRDPKEIRRAIVMREILGPPVGLK